MQQQPRHLHNPSTVAASFSTRFHSVFTIKSGSANVCPCVRLVLDSCWEDMGGQELICNELWGWHRPEAREVHASRGRQTRSAPLSFSMTSDVPLQNYMCFWEKLSMQDAVCIQLYLYPALLYPEGYSTRKFPYFAGVITNGLLPFTAFGCSWLTLLHCGCFFVRKQRWFGFLLSLIFCLILYELTFIWGSVTVWRPSEIQK